MMTRQERAKQFCPFDAMKGLQEALRDREERFLRVDKHDVSDEAAERNSAVLAVLRKGMRVRIDGYIDFHEVTLIAAVTEFEPAFRYLSADGRRIPFDDIYSIRIIEK